MEAQVQPLGRRQGHYALRCRVQPLLHLTAAAAGSQEVDLRVTPNCCVMLEKLVMCSGTAN